MALFYAHLLKELRLARLTRRGATHAPKDVSQGTHKEYPRMQRIMLPEPQTLEMSLSDTLTARHSTQAIDPNKKMSLEEVGTLFGNALRRRSGTTSRNYPSGGALYPIETYMITSALEGFPPSVFHYHPTEHALERLWNLPADRDVKSYARKPDELVFPSLIVFTSVWHRSTAKYGDLAFLHALLEAGHMSENIVLTTTAMGLESRPMAGFDDDGLVQILDLDEEFEQPVHSIVLGHAPTRPSTRSRLEE